MSLIKPMTSDVMTVTSLIEPVTSDVMTVTSLIEPMTSDVMTMTSLIKPLTSFVRRPASTRIRALANNRPARNDFRLGHGKSGPRKILPLWSGEQTKTHPPGASGSWRRQRSSCCFQGQADAMTAQTTAQKTADDAMTALRKLQITNGPTILALKDLLLAQFGAASQTLADFGLSPRKVRAPMTVAQKAAAAAKRKATRAARGTTGPKAKLAIKGTVPAPVETAPPVTAAAPAKPTA